MYDSIDDDLNNYPEFQGFDAKNSKKRLSCDILIQSCNGETA